MPTIDSLRQRFKNDPNFRPHILSIVFPAYKNIEFGAEITFDFPLTFLIGKNGTNKSSILQALYGCPEGKSVGEYWFSTHVDAIENIDGKRPAYFYRYRSSGIAAIPEVLKTRIKKDDDPDYWEPSRPVIGYGMMAMPPLPLGHTNALGRSKTRWNAMQKEVLYLDFRAEVSAFDKAFYNNDTSVARPARRNRLRKQSKPLKEVIDQNLQSRVYRNKERVFVNYAFSAAERSIVSEILGIDYSEIVYVEHDFYLSGSFSIYVSKGNSSEYSEAFAGSGESSVIRLVYALSKASSGTLALLDEPETSLHIAAQYELQNFILKMIEAKQLQVIVSTHSPFFTRGMPEDAIRILEQNQVTGRIRIINGAPSDESSFYLGYQRDYTTKVNVYVEDKLADALLQHVANLKLSAAQRDKISIIPYVGGKSELYSLAASEALKANSTACFIFDGDAYTNIPDPDTIPPNQDDQLLSIISTELGETPHFAFDSNTSSTAKAIRYRMFLKFCLKRFQRLPFLFPEEFIVQNVSRVNSFAGANQKEKIKNYAASILSTTGETRAQEIMIMQRQLIAEIAHDNPAFEEIAVLLKNALIFAPTI